MKKTIFVLGTMMMLFSCQKETSDLTGNTTETVAATSATSPGTESTMTMEESGRPLSATLTGGQEVPGPGDPDGMGMAKIRLNQGEGVIYYELSVSNIAPARAAHIHEAPAGTAGPVKVTLAPPANGTSRGMVKVSAELIKEIRKHPENYYVNVHNAVYPGGAVRGQLSK